MKWLVILAGVAMAVALLAKQSWSDSASSGGSANSEWPIPTGDVDDTAAPPGEDGPIVRYELPAGQARAYEDLTPGEQESIERTLIHVEQRAEVEKLLVEAAKERAVIAASEAAQIMLGAQDLAVIGVVP